MPCCHFGAFIVSSIHSGSDGSNIATPMLANVIEPAHKSQLQHHSALLLFLSSQSATLCMNEWMNELIYIRHNHNNTFQNRQKVVSRAKLLI